MLIVKAGVAASIRNGLSIQKQLFHQRLGFPNPIELAKKDQKLFEQTRRIAVLSLNDHSFRVNGDLSTEPLQDNFCCIRITFYCHLDSFKWVFFDSVHEIGHIDGLGEFKHETVEH